MTDYSKIKKILGIIGGILMVLLIVWFFRYESKKQAEAEKVYNVCATYEKGELEEALVLAKELDEPYNGYYTDYVTYAMELETWCGTEKELYDWLLRFLESYEEHKDVKVPNSELWNFTLEHDDIEYELECIEDALAWYPQYCLLKEEYYKRLFGEMRTNCERYLVEPEKGYVKISIPEIVAQYEDVQMFYTLTINKVKEIKSIYKMNETFSAYLELEMEVMKEFYEEGYVRNSLYTVYDEKIGQYKDFLYVKDSVARENYEVILNNYDKVISNYQNREFWESIGEIALGGLEEHGTNDSIVALEIYNIIDDVYIFETLEVIDSKVINIDIIYEEIFER